MQAFGSEMDIYTAWFFMGNIICRGVYRGGGLWRPSPPGSVKSIVSRGFQAPTGAKPPLVKKVSPLDNSWFL